jgi:NAD(P)H-dependent FMN reductase
VTTSSASTPLDLAIIIGSTREGRFGDTVGQWFAREAGRRADLAIDVIDVARLHLPAEYPQRPGPEVVAYRDRLDRADAFVVVTPEYNHSFPAGLKQAIDLAGHEWHRKPVGFVSYGGMSGGLRAVEHLRGVFAELHAVTIRDVVSLHQVWPMFDEAGELKSSPGTDAAVTTMLDHLVWWAHALRNARALPDPVLALSSR